MEDDGNLPIPGNPPSAIGPIYPGIGGRARGDG
jgi:hypothetical protein